ncbi:hypothetical protein BDR04DRAFT_1096704 [Suillus decipiens]|nr:hypothetical protein BDR04DRAFT_1096704 [Suillus decipiens]
MINAMPFKWFEHSVKKLWQSIAVQQPATDWQYSVLSPRVLEAPEFVHNIQWRVIRSESAAVC